MAKLVTALTNAIIATSLVAGSITASTFPSKAKEISVERDNCGRPVIWVQDIRGKWYGVRKGERSGPIELANRRFMWGCGTEADSSGRFTYAREWATCPEGTANIVVQREGGDSRRVYWHCQSENIDTVTSHPPGGTTSPNQQTSELLSYWHEHQKDNYTTGIEQGRDRAIQSGYVFARKEGRIFVSPQPGTVPLKTFWNSEYGDNYMTASAEGERRALQSGYQFARIEGYIYLSPQPGTVPLKTFWNSEYGDNYTTASAEGERRALQSGYQFARIEGYVFPPL